MGSNMNMEPVSSTSNICFRSRSSSKFSLQRPKTSLIQLEGLLLPAKTAPTFSSPGTESGYSAQRNHQPFRNKTLGYIDQQRAESLRKTHFERITPLRHVVYTTNISICPRNPIPGGRVASAFGLGREGERCRPRAAVLPKRELLPRRIETILRGHVHGGAVGRGGRGTGGGSLRETAGNGLCSDERRQPEGDGRNLGTSPVVLGVHQSRHLDLTLTALLCR